MDDSCEIQHLPQPIPSFTNGAWMDTCSWYRSSSWKLWDGCGWAHTHCNVIEDLLHVCGCTPVYAHSNSLTLPSIWLVAPLPLILVHPIPRIVHQLNNSVDISGLSCTISHNAALPWSPHTLLLYQPSAVYFLLAGRNKRESSISFSVGESSLLDHVVE